VENRNMGVQRLKVRRRREIQMMGRGGETHRISSSMGALIRSFLLLLLRRRRSMDCLELARRGRA
jgi:hypothetical protein